MANLQKQPIEIYIEIYIELNIELNRNIYCKKGPRSCPTNAYYYSGFTAMQSLIDNEWLKVENYEKSQGYYYLPLDQGETFCARRSYSRSADASQTWILKQHGNGS